MLYEIRASKFPWFMIFGVDFCAVQLKKKTNFKCDCAVFGIFKFPSVTCLVDLYFVQRVVIALKSFQFERSEKDEKKE